MTNFNLILIGGGVLFLFFFLRSFIAIHLVRPTINRKLSRGLVIGLFLALITIILLVIKLNLSEAFFFSAAVTSFFAILFVLRLSLDMTYGQTVTFMLIIGAIGWGIYIGTDKLSDLCLNWLK